MKVAVVRGKFLNKFEMQSFEPLISRYDITAFGSLSPYHDRFAFPVVKLPSPMDLPDFPYKMPILNRLFIDAQYLWGLEEKLRGFDVVHSAETYYRYTQQALNARDSGYVKKVIATVLENIPYNNEGIWGRKEFKKRARNQLDHIIALTNKTKEVLLTEGTNPKKITVIGHGIRTDIFTPSTSRAGGKKDFTILFTGRLEVCKGVYDIIHAAKILLNDAALQAFVLHFVFVGDGSEFDRLVDEERRLGIDQFVVHTHVSYDEMPAQYQEADIFVAPSKSTKTWEEQYCTALLEAQATGLPIVTTQSGGIPENVGDVAILIKPGDVEALARSLKIFILDAKLRQVYGKRARDRAVNVHDSQKIATRIADVYDMALAS